jgi:hypothetical protein
MKNGLEAAYEMVMEGVKEGTVKTNLKTGSAAMGDLKQSKQGGPGATGVKKPEEGEEKINPGHGKIKTEAREISNMLPQSKFDDLFKKQVIQEEDEFSSDESPLEMGGEEGFDDEGGDFPEEIGDETGEEVDVATELRMIIDRLTEVAEKLGSFDGEVDDADLDAAEAGMEDADAEGAPKLTPEAVQAKLKAFPDKTKAMQAKNNKVTSAFKVTSKKAQTGGPGKGAADGKLSPARKTTLGPKMSMKADVKGTMGKTGAGVFDSI